MNEHHSPFFDKETDTQRVTCQKHTAVEKETRDPGLHFGEFGSRFSAVDNIQQDTVLPASFPLSSLFLVPLYLFLC